MYNRKLAVGKRHSKPITMPIRVENWNIRKEANFAVGYGLTVEQNHSAYLMHRRLTASAEESNQPKNKKHSFS
jgi:hypothetical protein